jgi:hypothetical protein
MTETQERFLKAIAGRVPLERVAEIYLFPPIRQGGVEAGLAVIAAEPETAEPSPAAAALAAIDAPAPNALADASATAEADASGAASGSAGDAASDLAVDAGLPDVDGSLEGFADLPPVDGREAGRGPRPRRRSMGRHRR